MSLNFLSQISLQVQVALNRLLIIWSKNLGKIVYRGRLHLQVSLLLSRFFSMLGSLFLFQLFILFLAIPGSRYFIMQSPFLQV